MSWQGERRDSRGLLEDDPFASEAIERRSDSTAAVHAKSVGPRGVEGHEENVERRL